MVRSVATATALAALAFCGCAAAAPAVRPGPEERSTIGGSPFPHARLLPLVDGTVYRYLLETDGGEDRWLARVSRQSKTAGAIQFPTGTKHFEYLSDGVRLVAPPAAVYVLRAPIAVGNRWPGAAGSSIAIVAVDVTANVPAGRFVGCVQTLEQRGGDRPIRIATTFCPDVGIVELEAAAGAAVERAVLEHFGPPVEIAPGGALRAAD